MFAAITVAMGLGFLGYRTWKQETALREAVKQVAAAKEEAEARALRLSEATKAADLARERAAALEAEISHASASQQRLENEMKEALASRDIAVSELQGRLTVTMLDRVLFDSGEATLKPDGMRVLDELAKVLGRYTNRQVQIFGHTDNIPIRIRFASNWELSAARALAAVRHLSEKAGVDPHRLSAVACGEHQPLADNSTPEGRARNRRIAVVVLPEQFAPSDVGWTNSSGKGEIIPPVRKPGGTNAPADVAPVQDPVTTGTPGDGTEPAETNAPSPEAVAPAGATNTAPGSPAP